MSPNLRKALREDFFIFLRKAFGSCHPTKDFRPYTYLEFLSDYAERFEAGAEKNLIINLPPRHLKTFIFSKALPAWILGRNPSSEILVLTCSEGLAKDIAYQIRSILRTEWYRAAFPTRIAKDRGSLLDFATTAGGACFTTPIGASFTGRGANRIIMDDIIDLKDANNEPILREVCDNFVSRIESRLNDPSQDSMIYVGHRLSQNDPAGYLQNQGGWKTVALPWICPATTEYPFGGKIWHRKKGELLQPGSRSEAQIESKRTSCTAPDFETLYQQNPSGSLREPITAKHFRNFDVKAKLRAPVVLSVDAGQEISGRSSFSVIQAWVQQEGRHYLLDQWREQAEFFELMQTCRRFRFKYDVRAILIERAALGTPLLSEARRRKWKGVIPVIPDRRDKLARFLPLVDTITHGGVYLPADAEWRQQFVEELITFPQSLFTDQVDALTQYLEWSDGKPDFGPRKSRGIIAVAPSGSAASIAQGWPRDRSLMPTTPFTSPFRRWRIG